MLSPAVAVVCVCLPLAWTDGLHRARAELEREIAILKQQADELRLDVMVLRYRSGRNVESVGMLPRPPERSLRPNREADVRRRINYLVHQGRTSPEAFIGHLRELAEYLPQPELVTLTRRNLELQDQKAEVERELKAFRDELSRTDRKP